ncbi:MAG: error-prone DNA polymerase [Planctomycetota bacterium]
MYAELHCRTNYSFLTGASHADELVERAIALGYRGLAITDENTLAGVVRAFAAARAAIQAQPALDFKLLIGAELTFNDAPPLVVWAADRGGYGNLCRLLTLGRCRAPKGECWLRWEDFAAHQAGLMAGIAPGLSGDRWPLAHLAPGHKSYEWYAPALAARAAMLRRGDQQPDLEPLRRCIELLGDRAYLLTELYRGVDDRARLGQLSELSRATGLPLMAAGDVLYHDRARMPLHDVLTATRHQTTVAEAGSLLQPNAERHLRSQDELQQQFAAVPAALARTLEVVERCHFRLDELRYEYPEELAPAGQSPLEYLRELVWQGAARRYPQGLSPKVQRLLEHELQLIEELHYEAYFLTVWDLVRFARSRGILCQGRGSAANSAVCYVLGVTSVDPDTSDLLFERFISRERNEAPDIDVDFEHERREEVLQYLYQKYGRHRAGLAAAVITYRSRSAIRDVGKALGLSLDRVDALAKQVDGYQNVEDLPARCQAVGLDPQSRVGRQLCLLVDQLLGFPRHLSQHVGGMVMTRGNLNELVPIENAAMDGRTVIQWDKEDLEELGLLKVDCLCLGMLSAIRRCFALIEQHAGRQLTLADVPGEDPAVYDMICAADTIGVFQIESRGQMSMLPRLRPRCWYDLVIEVAIVRPGPIQGNMVHPYLRRRNGDELVTYPNQEIRSVLERTLGVPIFQEQAMKLAIVAAGFTPGEADQLRRAMGAWRKTGVIERFRTKLLEGMRSRGLSDEFAEQVFRQIRGFGEYGFPESHAASFALLVYVSAWLKHYYPAAFTAALLNSQPMGFYAPAQLVACARRHGVEIRPPDVNHSDWDATLEPYGNSPSDNSPSDNSPSDNSSSDNSSSEKLDWEKLYREKLHREKLHCENSPRDEAGGNASRGNWALRLGLSQIAGLPAQAAEAIVAARNRQGPFTAIADFATRCGLGQAIIARLSEADAFASLRQDRRTALWQALGQERRPLDQPLLESLSQTDDEIAELLPRLSEPEEVSADYQAVGLTLRAHPLAFCRSQLDELRVTRAADLAITSDGRQCRVAGLVILRQRPATAKGITFVTLEDETGTANLVVKPDIWQRYYQICCTSSAWLAHGKLERRSGVIHVVVNRLEDLTVAPLPNRLHSRDFR